MEGALSESGERWAKIISNLRETHDIDQKDDPLLVTFADITDPTTVQKVDPENLVATFGPGVSLKRISLEITDEPVTEGRIERVLGLLDDPRVMRNPACKSLPYEARVVINGLFKGELKVS